MWHPRYLCHGCGKEYAPDETDIARSRGRDTGCQTHGPRALVVDFSVNPLGMRTWGCTRTGDGDTPYLHSCRLEPIGDIVYIGDEHAVVSDGIDVEIEMEILAEIALS